MAKLRLREVRRLRAEMQCKEEIKGKGVIIIWRVSRVYLYRSKGIRTEDRSKSRI